MAHSFDTGLSVSQREAIKNAVVARLVAYPRLAAYIKRVCVLPMVISGRGDEAGRQALINEVLGQTPAIAVALGSKSRRVAGMPATELEGDLEFAIYVASEHNKGTVIGRLYTDAISAASTAKDPGVFIALEHVEEALMGQELGVSGTREVIPVGDEDEVITADNLTVWEQRYAVGVERVIKPWRFVTEVVTSIEALHNLDTTVDTDADPLVTTVSDLEES